MELSERISHIMRKAFEENIDPEGTNKLKWKTISSEIKSFYYTQFQVINARLTYF